MKFREETGRPGPGALMADASSFCLPVTPMEASFAPGLSPLRRLSPCPIQIPTWKPASRVHPRVPQEAPSLPQAWQTPAHRALVTEAGPAACHHPRACPRSEAAWFPRAVLGEVGTGPPVPLSFSPGGRTDRQAPSRQCPLAPGSTWQPSQLDTSLHLRGEWDSGKSGVHPGSQ